MFQRNAMASSPREPLLLFAVHPHDRLMARLEELNGIRCKCPAPQDIICWYSIINLLVFHY
jgi:hypothetical protein